MSPFSRYELKYVIDEPTAVAIRRFLSGYLRPSAHNQSGPFPGHPVVSLYLDSPDWVLFRQGFAAHRNRTKLRIRFYDSDEKRPAFLEIKRRIGDVIRKDRAMITRAGVRQMLAGLAAETYWPDESVLLQGRKRADVLGAFSTLCRQVRARGVVYISYVREIWEGRDDEELRVTLDRGLAGTPYDGRPSFAMPSQGLPPAPDRPPYYLPREGVILELKFDGRAPAWMERLVRTFNLRRTAVCKYCACIDSMELQWGRPFPQPWSQEPLAVRSWEDCR